MFKKAPATTVDGVMAAFQATITALNEVAATQATVAAVQAKKAADALVAADAATTESGRAADIAAKMTAIFN